VRWSVIVLFASLLCAACGNLELTCSGSTTLDSLVGCIAAQMPEKDSNGYVAPTAAQRADWRAVVNQMMQGSCDFTVPSSLNGIVRPRTFTDTSNGRNYCLLMEVRDRNRNGRVDFGFGTFIVNNAATRQLSHQAVHPVADSNTETQAVIAFRDTDSRSFLMAGAHRDANTAAGMCLLDARESDASHNSNTMVQATNEQLLAHYGATPFFVIQWHGMAASTCPNTDVYPSHGRKADPAPGERILLLRDNLTTINEGWDVDLPGSNSCGLNATENMQGRLLNGVAAQNVCSVAASAVSQKFIHIEQDPNFRNPADWTAAIVKTFP
jgi:hypothetical protein